MGFELSSDWLRASQLTRELQARESELRRERALADAMFDSGPGLLYLYTADGRFVRWNRQHESRTGYTSAKMAKMTSTDWFDREDQAAIRTAWQDVITGRNVTIELPVKM